MTRDCQTSSMTLRSTIRWSTCTVLESCFSALKLFLDMYYTLYSITVCFNYSCVLLVYDYKHLNRKGVKVSVSYISSISQSESRIIQLTEIFAIKFELAKQFISYIVRLPNIHTIVLKSSYLSIKFIKTKNNLTYFENCLLLFKVTYQCQKYHT